LTLKSVDPVEVLRSCSCGEGLPSPYPSHRPFLGPHPDHFFVSGARFARKYVYILHGTLKNTCVFATYARWCAKTLEKTRENHARVHSKSLWAHLRVQKHCAGALKVTLGSQGWSKTPRKLKKTMHRGTQSHLGFSCAFKNTAQVHLKLHFGLTQAVILLINMDTFCMGPSKTQVFFPT